jgi:hypothetical protein
VKSKPCGKNGLRKAKVIQNIKIWKLIIYKWENTWDDVYCNDTGVPG